MSTGVGLSLWSLHGQLQWHTCHGQPWSLSVLSCKGRSVGVSPACAANLILLRDVGDSSEGGWKHMENLLVCCFGKTQILSGVTPLMAIYLPSCMGGIARPWEYAPGDTWLVIPNYSYLVWLIIMYAQANECTAEPPLWLRSKALLSSASFGQPEPAEGTGEVGRGAGFGVNRYCVQKNGNLWH